MSSERESLEVESAMERKVIREWNRECRIAFYIDAVVTATQRKNETKRTIMCWFE